jgi:glycosyltransferase involved in cell wall biosynthesis
MPDISRALSRFLDLSRQNSVLMVVPRYKPAIGGIEKHVERVTGRLKRLGIDITILTASHKAGLAEREEGNPEIVRMPVGYDKSPIHAFWWMLKNRKWILQNRLIHFHGTVQILFWYLPLILLKPGKPLYATFHGFERDPVPFYWILFRKIARLLVRGSICIGHFIPDIYGIKCDFVINGAVAGQTIEQKNGTGAVFAGRLEPDTGFQEHLEALRLLKQEKGRELALSVCGTGSLMDYAQQFAEKNRLDIRLLGWVEDVWEIIAKSKIMLAGGYLSILEAMSLGLPVIGIATSKLKHLYLMSIIREEGPLSLQNHPRGVAEEIDRILENPELYSNISEQSRRFASRKSWRTMVKHYLHLWMDKM